MAGRPVNPLLNASPAPDFSDPLGLLRACHQRILSFCDLLTRLMQHIEAHGVDDEARQVAMKIHRYFSTAAIQHHLDEEQDLFPLLTPQSQQLSDTIRRLTQQHEQFQGLWAKLEPVLANPERIQECPDCQTLAEQFSNAYREHIREEEQDLLPLAEQLLSREQLIKMGAQMKQRRDNAIAV